MMIKGLSFHRSRVSDIARRFGLTTALVLLSQGISAASLFTLPALGFGVSDIYSIAIQVGNGPLNGAVLGVVYLLAIGRPSFSAWKVCSFFVLGTSVIFSGLAMLLISIRGNESLLPPRTIYEIVLLFGFGSVFLGLTGIRGVREACLGRPYLLAGCSIVPNAGMAISTLILALMQLHNALTPLIPAATWAASAGAMGIITLVVPITGHPDETGLNQDQKDSDSNRRSHAIGLCIGVATSTLFPIAFVSSVGHLKPGSATILFIVSRIGSALIGILVNSVLLVNHSWTAGDRTISRYPAVLAWTGFFAGLASLSFHYLRIEVFTRFGIYTSYCSAMIAWLSCTAATPVILRETNVRKLGGTILLKSILDILITTLTAFILFWHPTVTGFFAVTLISQCVTCIICGLALKDRSTVIPSIYSTAVGVALLAFGW